MAVTVKEIFRGVRGSQDTRQIEYLVEGATDDNNALDALELRTPFRYDNMWRSDIGIEEVSKSAGTYKAVAIYDRSEPIGVVPDLNGNSGNKWQYSFDTGLQTVKVARSRFGTTRYIPAKSDAVVIPFQGINATGKDLKYDGADIRKPLSVFQLDFFPADRVMTGPFQRLVQSMVGKINGVAIFGYQPGELLLTGVTGRSRNGTNWQLTYRFEVSHNFTDKVGQDSDRITYTARGHDLVWVFYEEEVQTLTDASGNDREVTVQVPRQVNVEKVYAEANFALLFPR